MLQAYNDWVIDEWCGSLPGPVHPARHRARCGTSTSRSRRSTASARRAAGRSASSRRPHVQGFPSFLSGHWDPMLKAICDENMVLSLHIGAGFEVIQPARRRRPIDHLMVLACADQRASPRRTCCSARRCGTFPDLQGRAVRGRHRLDPVLPRPDRPPLPEPDVAARRRRLRRQAAVRGVPRAHPRLLHHRPVRPRCCATGSASTSSPGSATTPTPTRRGRSRPSSPGRSSRTPAAPTRRSTRSRGRTPAGSSTGTRSQHTPKEQATVGALRALATDVDTTRMSRAEWKQAQRGRRHRRLLIHRLRGRWINEVS